MQVETITKLWSLPPEFEVFAFSGLILTGLMEVQIICRDIWGLHLSLLANPPPPEPYLHAQEGEKDRKSGINPNPKDSSAHGAMNTQTLDGPSGDVNRKHSNEDDRSGSGDDSEMEELLRENSEISSSSEEGEDDYDPRNGGRAGIDGWRSARSVESLASTLAVLVVAFWQLRIPIMYKDLIKCV
jgi:RNA polymerase I-specific transcription initiation factor RRN7